MTRTSNPLSALKSLVERTLTVAHVVSGELWSIEPNEHAADAAASLAAQDFDVAGVASESITNYVTRSDLDDAGTRRVARCCHPILASMCVEKSLPLSILFEKLAAREYVFVLDNDEVRFVVTRADLQSPAIGVVVLAYLTFIETGLREIVLAESGDAWLDPLSEKRREECERLFDEKRRQNVGIGMEDCLFFTDWLSLATRVPKVRQRLGFTSKGAAEAFALCFVQLRNNLAHGGTILDGVDPLKALDRVERVRAFAERVWRAVDSLSDVWDMYATTVLERARNQGVLAGPGADVRLRFALPAHVITAWNPGSVKRSREGNRVANVELRAVFKRQGVKPTVVIGHSPDDRWREEGFLVSGLSTERASEIGAMFGQRAIFELDAQELRVIRCPDGETMRSVGRCG